MLDFIEARTNMVECQLRPNGITDARILDAMQAISREDYVFGTARATAYPDCDVPLVGANSARYLIVPMAFAKMVQAAGIKSNDKILEIGSATGYGSAIFAQLARHVVAVESDAFLFSHCRNMFQDGDNVTFIQNSLPDGWAESAPYDVILVSGQIEFVPEALFSQLSEGGRLVATTGLGPSGKCNVWTRVGASLRQKYLFDLAIAALPGFGKHEAAFAF